MSTAVKSGSDLRWRRLRRRVLLIRSALTFRVRPQPGSSIRPLDMISQLAREAMIPNPRLAAFKPLIGVWTTVGRHPMIPGITLHGQTAFEWHEGGAFLRMRSEIDEPGIPSGIAIIGGDDQAEAFTMLYFDERTVARRYEVAMDGSVLRWWRTPPGFSQRYVLTVSPDGDTLHGAGELSKDGTNWDPDLELSYTRARSAPLGGERSLA